MTRDRLRELGVEFVDITDINKESLLYQKCDRIKIREKFRAAGIDGLFFPHGNFGTVGSFLIKEILICRPEPLTFFGTSFCRFQHQLRAWLESGKDGNPFLFVSENLRQVS